MKTIEMLINEIKASEGMQKQLAEAAKNKNLASYLKEQGCEANAEEFIAALKVQAGQLSDNELDTVAGGANGGEAILSIVTLGIGCAIEAITSACGDGVGNGHDGKILCNNEPTNGKPIVV